MKRLPDPQIAVDEFNRTVKIGDEVEYRAHPGAKPVSFKTRSAAYVMGDHTAVVFLEGKSGCVACRACHKPKVTA